MEWYVVNYDFNRGKAYFFNIFDSSRLNDGLEKLPRDNKEEFIKELNSLLRYCFWSKCEYEIYVTDAFHDQPNEITQIDVYEQLKPNLNILADYIWNNIDNN